MKKVMMIAAIAAALVSCQSKGNQNNDTMDEGVMTVVGNDSSAVAVYERSEEHTSELQSLKRSRMPSSA